MDAPEVPIDECVSGLGVVVRTVSESKMPRGVVVPRMPLQERASVVSTRLNVAPHAFEHVLVCVDEPSCLSYGVLINYVRGHGLILSESCRFSKAERPAETCAERVR